MPQVFVAQIILPLQAAQGLDLLVLLAVNGKVFV
jgi:hypothetical protein